jgi:ClpP class serine protease
MRSLLHKFAFGIWAIRPEAVDGYLQQVDDVMRGRAQSFGPRDTTPEDREKELMAEANMRFVTREGRTIYAAQETVNPEPGLVMVLDLKGPVMKEDFCGAPGTQTMGRWMQSADASPEVEGVVLNMDSPGGDGYGMADLSAVIERMGKPVVSIVQAGMACSAAYGIAAAGDLVLSSNTVDEFGSIGTYVRLRDYRKADEDKGVKTHVITATRSTEKLKDYQEALKADHNNPDDEHYSAIRENYINPFNEAFIALVQRNRPTLKDERGTLNGRVFMANEALTLGLIDATNKTLADAIDAVRSLTANNTNNN